MVGGITLGLRCGNFVNEKWFLWLFSCMFFTYAFLYNVWLLVLFYFMLGFSFQIPGYLCLCRCFYINMLWSVNISGNFMYIYLVEGAFWYCCSKFVLMQVIFWTSMFKNSRIIHRKLSSLDILHQKKSCVCGYTCMHACQDVDAYIMCHFFVWLGLWSASGGSFKKWWWIFHQQISYRVQGSCCSTFWDIRGCCSEQA